MAILDNLFGAPPEYLTGLLAPDQTDKLRKQAMTTGLINSAIALIAQPRNQRYGSALPYIGKALMAGQQAGQGVYSNALQGLETQQKLAEFKRKQDQQQKMQEMIGSITDPNERLFAQLAPEQYVTGKLKPTAGQSKLLTLEEQKNVGLPETGRYQVKADGSYELVSGTAPKESSTPSAVQEYQFAKSQGYNGSFQQWKESQKPAGINVTYGAPVAGVNAQGEPVFFQPAKGGGAPAVIPGVSPPPREEKAPTESQAKASAYGSQMQSASQEFDQIQKEGFVPGATTAQAQVELAATPLRMLADPLAQRALQSQEQWAEAFLRYKTGAAATEGEVKRNINTYFPKIGETNPKVIEQKARMRKQAEQDVLKSAAPSGKQIMPKNEAMPTTRRKFNPATGRIE
jgi:hypothetical protein